MNRRSWERSKKEVKKQLSISNGVVRDGKMLFIANNVTDSVDSLLKKHYYYSLLRCIIFLTTTFSGDVMPIKTKFKDGIFIPLEKVKEVNDGEVVEIEIKPKKKFTWRGALKFKKESAVELQHNIKDTW